MEPPLGTNGSKNTLGHLSVNDYFTVTLCEVETAKQTTKKPNQCQCQDQCQDTRAQNTFQLQGIIGQLLTKDVPLPLTNMFQRGYFVKFMGESPLTFINYHL